MANVSFKKGTASKLPASYAEGTFYVTTDERAIYLDVSNDARIRIGDFQEFKNITELNANVNPSMTALYYISDINCLAKWNGTKYVQINRDTGVTSVEVTGAGNAVTAAVIDATGRKLTLTKGATYVTAAEVDKKITDKIGAIDGTVKKYIDDKTSGIVTDASMEALTKRVDAAETSVSTLSDKVGTVPAGKTVVQMIEEAKTATTYDDSAVKADIKKNADAIGVLNGSGVGSVDKKITDAFNDFATKVSDDGVVNSYKELIDWAATHGAEAATMAGEITALKNILKGIGGTGESATVVAYVAKAIENLKIGDYAKASELTALAQRVTAAEGKITTLTGTGEGSVKKALVDAKAYADGLAGNYDTKGDAAQALKDAKAYTDSQALTWGEF
ncbi:hypothetical protein [Dysosmobacter sp.]|uniref:hypothetical protein n=1 Tax=Dysosmobacter sp. TaxID=2591382 RepID=UPI003A8DF1BB